MEAVFVSSVTRPLDGFLFFLTFAGSARELDDRRAVPRS
jgi:hypothetical protein